MAHGMGPNTALHVYGGRYSLSPAHRRGTQQSQLSKLLRDPSHSTSVFGPPLKTFLLSKYYSALDALMPMRYINLRFITLG